VWAGAGVRNLVVGLRICQESAHILSLGPGPSAHTINLNLSGLCCCPYNQCNKPAPTQSARAVTARQCRARLLVVVEPRLARASGYAAIRARGRRRLAPSGDSERRGGRRLLRRRRRRRSRSLLVAYAGALTGPAPNPSSHFLTISPENERVSLNDGACPCLHYPGPIAHGASMSPVTARQ
jgi:hypothetical protein